MSRSSSLPDCASGWRTPHSGQISAFSLMAAAHSTQNFSFGPFSPLPVCPPLFAVGLCYGGVTVVLLAFSRRQVDDEAGRGDEDADHENQSHST